MAQFNTFKVLAVIPPRFYMNRNARHSDLKQRFDIRKHGSQTKPKQEKKFDYKTKYYQQSNERRWTAWKDEKLVQLIEEFKARGDEIDYEYLSNFFKQHQGCIRRRYALLQSNRLLVPSVQQNLIKMVQEYIKDGKMPDWEEISQQIGATAKECERQYGKSIEKTWTKQLDEKLVKLIQIQKEAGQINWLDIGQQLGNLTGKACMQHYTRMYNTGAVGKSK